MSRYSVQHWNDLRLNCSLPRKPRDGNRRRRKEVINIWLPFAWNLFVTHISSSTLHLLSLCLFLSVFLSFFLSFSLSQLAFFCCAGFGNRLQLQVKVSTKRDKQECDSNFESRSSSVSHTMQSCSVNIQVSAQFLCSDETALHLLVHQTLVVWNIVNENNNTFQVVTSWISINDLIVKHLFVYLCLSLSPYFSSHLHFNQRHHRHPNLCSLRMRWNTDNRQE